MKVRVYKNLRLSTKRDPMYSVMYKGRVIAHVRSIILAGAKFIVRESGRQRVLREKRKNVHAFVEGEWARGKKAHRLFGTCFFSEVKYNPYMAPTFIRTAYRTPIHIADGAMIGKSGVFALFRYNFAHANHGR